MADRANPVSAPSSGAAQRWPWLIVAALLMAYFVMAITASRRNSVTYDEVAHIVGGYVQWMRNDFRMNPENGMVAQRIAALPLCFGKQRLPPLEQSWRQSDEWTFGRQFLFESGNDTDRIVLYGRAMIALVSCATGLCIFLLSRRLFGTAGGLLSLALFAFCPTMLSHGALITSDAVTSLFFLLAVASIWAVAQRATVLRVVASCACVSLLLLCKTSGILLLPMAGLMAAIHILSPAPAVVALRREHVITKRSGKAGFWAAMVLLHATVAWAVIWVSAGLRYSAFSDQDPRNTLLKGGWAFVEQQHSPSMAVISQLRKWQLLPEGYLYGSAYVLRHAGGRYSFARGEFGTTGWWWYFPYAVLVKTPVPLWILLALGTAAILRKIADSPGKWRNKQCTDRVFAAVPLLVLCGVYIPVAMAGSLNIGHRHMMPIYPVLFIAAGAAVHWRGRWGQYLAALCAVWFAVESLVIRPHYLAYFNQLAGGPRQGYTRLVDSSLDWGQALPSLKAWLDQREKEGNSSPVYLSYFGTADLRHYGIGEGVRILPCSPPQPGEPTAAPEPYLPGTYCISASILQGPYVNPPGPWTIGMERAYGRMLAVAGDPRRPDAAALARIGIPGGDSQYNGADVFRHLRLARLCAYLRHRRPDAMAGYAILIFNLSDDDLRTALLGAPAELVE